MSREQKTCPKCRAMGRVTRTRKRKRDGVVVRDRMCGACGCTWADGGPRMRAGTRGTPVRFTRGTVRQRANAKRAARKAARDAADGAA